jgi:hypothetical protein
MNKRLSAIILALATSALLAIGCGSTASFDLPSDPAHETEDGWDWGDLTETEADAVEEPGLEAEYLESEAPVFAPPVLEPKK